MHGKPLIRSRSNPALGRRDPMCARGATQSGWAMATHLFEPDTYPFETLVASHIAGRGGLSSNPMRKGSLRWKSIGGCGPAARSHGRSDPPTTPITSHLDTRNPINAGEMSEKGPFDAVVVPASTDAIS